MMGFRTSIDDKTVLVVFAYKGEFANSNHYKDSLNDAIIKLKSHENWVQVWHGQVNNFIANKNLMKIHL